MTLSLRDVTYLYIYFRQKIFQRFCFMIFMNFSFLLIICVSQFTLLESCLYSFFSFFMQSWLFQSTNYYYYLNNFRSIIYSSVIVFAEAFSIHIFSITVPQWCHLPLLSLKPLFHCLFFVVSGKFVLSITLVIMYMCCFWTAYFICSGVSNYMFKCKLHLLCVIC